MEFTGNYRNAGASIEAILFFTCITTMTTKHFCVTFNRRTIAKNIYAAIDDWILARNDEETYKVMKKYAVVSKWSTTFIIYSTYICLGFYVLGVILLNFKEKLFHDVNVSNGNVFIELLHNKQSNNRNLRAI